MILIIKGDINFNVSWNHILLWSQHGICILPAFGINNKFILEKKPWSIVNANYDINEYSLIEQWLQSGYVMAFTPS